MSNWIEREIQEERRNGDALKRAEAFAAQVRADDEAKRRRRERLDLDIAVVEAERERRADAYMNAIGYRPLVDGREHTR